MSNPELGTKGPEVGTIKYEIEPRGLGFRVVSSTFTLGMGRVPGWFRNYVAECKTIAEAQAIINRLTA